MSLRRALGVLVLTLTALVGVSSPASADPYSSGEGSIKASRTSAQQGQYVHIQATGFCANSPTRLRVSVNGDTYVSGTITSDHRGVVSTNVQLTRVGQNVISVSGCRAAGGTQRLSVTVTVRPHQGKANANADSVQQGASVNVSGRGFCKNAPVAVRMSDDGRLYKKIMIHANRFGRAKVSVELYRKGLTTIALRGCRAKGGVQSLASTVQVQKGTSFTASPAAYVGKVAGQPTTAVLGLAALGLLFAGVQVGLARRRRGQRA